MLLFEKPYLTIAVDGDRQIHTWSGHLSEIEYRTGIDAIVATLERTHVRKMLTDTSQVGSITQAMHAYMEERLPQMYAAGLRYLCFVMPARMTAQISIEIATERIRRVGITATIVGTLADARLWLDTQP